ncbi:ATP-binding cassette (ABC) Superfamily [Phytophthora palmivora]|uniref:ATP-binding cassette (ABC) Superfamily n=1 Tax=Phytophthora palmivora TaxID=4796 RepID=A0A2P4YPL8_9STRA|nr:ATP-binding cassette (ABC) Superfamily [Phytophthora palmivora]
MFLEHLKAPRGLNHGRTSRGAYERALVQDEPLFVNDIEAARCVLLAPHRIPLKEFTSLRKKPEDRGGLFPVWGYPWGPYTVRRLKSRGLLTPRLLIPNLNSLRALNPEPVFRLS